MSELTSIVFDGEYGNRPCEAVCVFACSEQHCRLCTDGFMFHEATTVSPELIVLKALQILSECKYFYKWTAIGCFIDVKVKNNWRCDATDEELLEVLDRAWQNLKAEGVLDRTCA